MTTKIFPLVLAALLASSCMTAAQKRDKSDAEAAVSAAGATVAAARLAGGEAYSSSRMRSAESDFRMAQDKLKAGDWEEARRRARLASSVAEDIRSESERDRNRASATKLSPLKKKAKAGVPK